MKPIGILKECNEIIWQFNWQVQYPGVQEGLVNFSNTLARKICKTLSGGVCYTPCELLGIFFH